MTVPVHTNPNLTRAFVSLSELAEDILNLSRARVYELIERGALPHPIYDLRTRRPMFNAELIEQARTVRQTGVGVDGSCVLFYRRDRTPTISYYAGGRSSVDVGPESVGASVAGAV
jgi:hypothetical protein